MMGAFAIQIPAGDRYAAPPRSSYHLYDNGALDILARSQAAIHNACPTCTGAHPHRRKYALIILYQAKLRYLVPYLKGKTRRFQCR